MWEIQRLSKEHDRDSFDCEVDDLNIWLKRYARQSDRRGETATRVVVPADADRVVGYYATRAYQLEGSALSAAIGRSVKYPAPCILLGRLARCKSVRGLAIGDLLMEDMFARSLEVADAVGVRFLVVHAIDDRAVSFYERHGFQRFLDHHCHLLMPVDRLRRQSRA